MASRQPVSAEGFWVHRSRGRFWRVEPVPALCAALYVRRFLKSLAQPEAGALSAA